MTPYPICADLAWAVSVLGTHSGLFSLQQMERILKKASKTHKQRVEVSPAPVCVWVGGGGLTIAQRVQLGLLEPTLGHALSWVL